MSTAGKTLLSWSPRSSAGGRHDETSYMVKQKRKVLGGILKPTREMVLADRGMSGGSSIGR